MGILGTGKVPEEQNKPEWRTNNWSTAEKGDWNDVPEDEGL